jgi:tetratricopeptide (TPR) repeat protein
MEERNAETVPSATSDAGDERTVRVFISSTFRDMQRERDELVKRTFPRLRELCEQRGVVWTDVDLRWGITDEQQAEGGVLPVCMEEIRRCRPYFIGLLGERYGWVPDTIPAGLLAAEPWLADHSGSSVTELEILEGVLNDPGRAECAFFYFRGPLAAEDIPEAERADFVDGPAGADITRYGAGEAQDRAADRPGQLAALKDRIRASGLPVREGFRSPEELGELVYRDLASVICTRYPQDSRPTPDQRERAAHDTFATNRARDFAGRGDALAALDAHATGSGPPLTVTGLPGIGKSALLAAWTLRHRHDHPGDLVVLHFAGVTPSSANPAALVRRLLTELSDICDTSDGLPWDPVELRERLAARLASLAASGRHVLLVIAGLDQLDDREGGLELAWLPRSLPPETRVILSSCPGRPLDEIGRRGWPVLELQPLPAGERRDLAVRYLARYGKALTAAQADRIVSAPQTGNPLYLRTLLEELRLFGAFELIDARIGHYLAATSPADLFGLVLDRCAQDYDRERPDLTGEALALLCAARRGLAEEELVELLGSDGRPMPRAYWSPLFLALEGSFTRHAGLLRIGHSYLADAAAARYLPTTEQARTVHGRLADYFAARPLGERLVDELPWQLSQAGEWDRLRDVLTDPGTFDALWHADRLGVMARWAEAEAASDLRMADAYRPWAAVDLPYGTISYAADLLRASGHLAQALTLAQRLVALAEMHGDQREVAQALDTQATVHMGLGHLAEALALFSREEALCREAGDWFGAGRALNNEANVLAARGDVTAAADRYELTARGWRAIGDRTALAATLGNQAVLLVHHGEFDRAAALFEEQAKLSRELGDPISLSTALDGAATVLMNRGDYLRAMSYLTEEEQILRRYGQREGLATCIGNQAVVKNSLGDLEGALQLFSEAAALSREAGNRQGEAESLGRQGAALVEHGRYDEAMMLLDQQEAIARDLGLAAELEICLGNKAIIRRAHGDLSGALTLLDEKVRLCRQLGDQRSLAIALGNQGNIALLQGEPDRALTLYQEKERIDRNLGNPKGLAHVLWNEANIYLSRLDYQQALTLIEEEVALRRQLANAEQLAHALIHRVEALAHLGSISEALASAQEAYDLAQQNGVTDLAAGISQIIQALR